MSKFLNRLRFIFVARNYTTDRTVDDLIKKIMKLEIRQCTYGKFHVLLTTESYSYKLWNGNKYYGWLSDGTVYDNDKNEIIVWHNKMPSKKTMAEFKLFLESYIDKNIIDKLS